MTLPSTGTFHVNLSHFCLPMPAYGSPRNYSNDSFARGRICKNGTNLQKARKKDQLWKYLHSFSLISIKMAFDMHFCQFLDIFKHWGIPKFNLKSNSFMNKMLIFQNYNFGRQIRCLICPKKIKLPIF